MKTLLSFLTHYRTTEELDSYRTGFRDGCEGVYFGGGQHYNEGWWDGMAAAKA